MRILLVEDNLELAETIKKSLGQQGYDVDVARTAAEGDEAAFEQRYDMIILDVMLPDRTGVELCRNLRRQQAATPVLMLTVLGSVEDKIAGLDAGVLMRRWQAMEDAVLRSGDLVMDLYEHRVTIGGVSVKLSGKEFALLEFMMRNPRKLLTRAMISESVWNMNYESTSNVIDVHISNLRRKIDRWSKKPRIETVIGSGYRFVNVGQSDDLMQARPMN